MSRSLRSSLRSLRSLLVEIYPPDLGADALAAALEDLVAPAASAGVTARVEVHDVQEASQDSVRLVWRVAQEAVRNALRHADARRLTVEVGTAGELLTLDVSDDGQGFPAQQQSQPDNGGIGLRALRDLVREAGGRLQVRSATGSGTTVHLEVPR
jgi:two-component system NarL family sensor kinase